jgi:hypothetical protein
MPATLPSSEFPLLIAHTAGRTSSAVGV